MGLRQLATGNESNAPLVERARQNETLHGRRLLLARCVGAVLTVFLLAYFIANLPVYFAQLQTVCIHALCPHWQLTPANARTLQNAGFSVSPYTIFSLALGLFSALVWFAVAAFIAWRKPSDWMAGLSSLFLVTAGVLLFSGGPLPPLAYSSPAWYVPTLSLFLLFSILYFLVFSLFPNGQFVPGWMRWLVIVQIALGVIVLCLPTAFSTPGVVFAFTPLTITGLLCAWTSIIGGQIYRYRRVSSPTERQQTKWVVLGLIVGPVVGSMYYFSPLAFPSLSGSGSLYFLLFTPVYTIASLFSPLCFGIALLRYRLWDIDVIINRTLVYGTLSASVIGLYVLIVGYFGVLFQTTNTAAISFIATALVAIVFQPLRSLLQRGVNRLIYGERDDPYAVLARLGSRLEVALIPEKVLPTIVETVAQALKLPYVAIALVPEQHPVTPTPAGTTAIAGTQEADIVVSYGTPTTKLVRIPLTYQGETIGYLLLAPRLGDTFSKADSRLFSDLARQAGVAVYAVRLTAHLKQLTESLQQAREHLVTTREEERRRLRRDLHDGLGPTLGHLTLQLDGVRDLIAEEPSAAITQVTQLKANVQDAMNDIRRLVYELRPPALDELGLVTALREQMAQYHGTGGLAVTIEAPASLPPFPAAVEVAVYRIALEALTNIVRHAQASTCRMILTVTDELVLEIDDDGRGLPTSLKAGIGLLSMRERAAELGGTCVIEATSEGGTRVRARLPLPKE